MRLLNLRWCAALLLAVVSACGAESLRTRPDEPDAVYWDLQLSHHAVALSMAPPYDTLQITATPVNYRDEPLVDLPVPQYSSKDPDRVVVTSDGVLIAVAPTTQPVAVVATLTAKNLKHADTVMVSVTDGSVASVLESFSIHPVPPDSAKIAARNAELTQPLDTLRPRAVAVGGEPIPVFRYDVDGYLPVYFWSADTTVVHFGPDIGLTDRKFGELVGVRVGTTTVYATTTAFGVTKTDTLPYRIGWPVLGNTVLEVPLPEFGFEGFHIRAPDLTIGTGGAVVWPAWGWLRKRPDPADTLDITFADSDVMNIAPIRPIVPLLQTFGASMFLFCRYDCDSGGNILITGDAPLIARQFPVPGTYEYRSTRKGIGGRIVVVDER